MPLYEYQCKKCGHRFERIQSFSAESVKECPVCHGEVERLISAPAVHFKGSGFYSTDYGAKPSAKSGSDTSKQNSSSDGATATPDNSSPDKSSAGKSEAASSSAPAEKTGKSESGSKPAS